MIKLIKHMLNIKTKQVEPNNWFTIAGDYDKKFQFVREGKSIWLRVVPHSDFTVPSSHLRVRLRQRDVSELILFLQGGK